MRHSLRGHWLKSGGAAVGGWVESNYLINLYIYTRRTHAANANQPTSCFRAYMEVVQKALHPASAPIKSVLKLIYLEAKSSSRSAYLQEGKDEQQWQRLWPLR